MLRGTISNPKFQFQYGSIKRIFGMPFRKGKYEFQFQYGSIKSQQADLPLLKHKCFNSSMVQLKECFECRIYCSLKCFNSSMVQLKDERTRSRSRSLVCFNSSMVQLKAITWSTYICSTNVSIPVWFN